MRNLTVSLPELAFIAATRGVGGVGIGLLASSYIRAPQRQKLGLALLAIGVLTSIPIALTARRRFMRYSTIHELPNDQVDQYDGHQKEAFLKAFNGAYRKYKRDEFRAFEAAHLAAIKAGDVSPRGSS